jgi:hypothetical protein
MRKKLPEEEKKVRVIITLAPELNKFICEKTNKSKYIETLIRNDFNKQNNEN